MHATVELSTKNGKCVSLSLVFQQENEQSIGCGFGALGRGGAINTGQRNPFTRSRRH